MLNDVAGFQPLSLFTTPTWGDAMLAPGWDATGPLALPFTSINYAALGTEACSTRFYFEGGDWAENWVFSARFKVERIRR
jgi:hypothetical protein